MLQIIFGGMLGLSLLYGLITGKGAETAQAMLAGAQGAVETAFAMAGGFAFFCGMIAILRRAGAMGFLSRKLAPGLKKLMGKDVAEEALEYIAMNFSANLLGLGNAATPMGIEAAKRMAGGEQAGNALCLFLVINASSVQLMPSTVIALRAAAGSQDPASILVPTLLATFLSTLAGILSCKLLEKKS